MNILLITSGLNNDKSSSWLVFSKLISYMRVKYNAKIHIVCFSPHFKNKDSRLGEIVYSTFFNNTLLLNTINSIDKQYLWKISNFYAKFYSKRIIKYIEKNNIDKLWIKADLQPFLLLDKIKHIKSIPYHISVFDDPYENQGYKSFKKKATSLFNKGFSNASSIDTPTSFLHNYYKDRNLINCKTKVTESYVGIFKNSNIQPKINKKVTKIALTGSVYGMDALISFILAVSDILIKEKIEFHLITNTFNIHLKYLKSKYGKAFEYIKIKPFIPEYKIIKELQNYDLLYLPMKFEENYRFQTNSSFPSKTHNYLASKIPIIVHAPKSASINNFFIENNICCTINTLNKDEIKSIFNRLLKQDERQYLSDKISVFNNTLIQNNHMQKLFELINNSI